MMEIKVGGEGRAKNEGFDFFALNFEFNYLSFLHIFFKFAHHYVCGLDLLLLTLGAPHGLLDLDTPPVELNRKKT